MQDKLTEKQFWEEYWTNIELPLEVKRENSAPNIIAELNILEKYLNKDSLSILEIGGAPGQYLAYFHNNFGYSVSCLDYSEVGCEKTKENFSKLDIDGKVYQGDLFSDELQLPLFDIVCSFGFIEHFNDLKGVVEQHLKLLKPGGTLLLGVPNLIGINHWFLKRLAPKLLADHNLKTMDIDSWKEFEKAFNLDVVFKDYVGGFEPAVFLKNEKGTALSKLLFLFARILNRIFHNNFTWLRKYNSKKYSGYLIGIYKKPGNL